MSTPSRTPEQIEAEIAVLEANAAFYRAFHDGDLAAMEQVWAEQTPTVCVHPGMRWLVGRRAILGSWAQILSELAGFDMSCRQPRVHLLGDVALVTCLEANGDKAAHLVATNVFVREGSAWRMVHHHAGPLSKAVPAEEGTTQAN